MHRKQEGKIPNYEEIIREILVAVDGPISIEDLAAQILLKRPSNARNPLQAALLKIHECNGRQLVFLNPTHVLPLRLAYHGARYRMRLTRENVDQAALPINNCFHHYLPPSFEEVNITFNDAQGNAIPSLVQAAPHTITFSSGMKVEYKESVVVLKEWFRSQKIDHKDHILVTIEDWEQGVFRLELERSDVLRPDRLAERNRYFADAFFEILESAQNENSHVKASLPTIYAKLADKNGYPPDQWMVIIENDPRMRTDGWSISYTDTSFYTPENIYAKATGQNLDTPEKDLTEEEVQQVYCFRAQLKYKPSIWREIEIQGKQNLWDLDRVLRIAFQHDTFDHLSGFWQKVVRSGGPRKRYREVDLGTVNPFEYDDSADTTVASLKLNVGDQLKYVYDFGDWIEHQLEVKSIGDPENGIKYPREIARNKPKYTYCIECQKKGKETVATWICFTCSNEQQRDILVCEKCLREHDDHYLEEFLY